MNRLLLCAALALLSGTGIAFADGIPIHTPQGDFTLTDATVQWLCGDNGAWLKYLASVTGASMAASAVSNYSDKLPQPLRTIVNVIALNLRDAKPPAANPNLKGP